MSSRSWTRADDFAYPLGLSSPWAESGAGYGVFPEAVRVGTREFEIGLGKIRFEATYAQADKRKPLNPSSTVDGRPPRTCTRSSSSTPTRRIWSRRSTRTAAVAGRARSPRALSTGRRATPTARSPRPEYEDPSENVLILQGNYWMNPTWSFTYGLKRSEWSGQAQQCDYGPVSPVESDCFWDQPGFNYSDDLDRMHDAVEYDVILGAAYTRGKWIYTVGGVRLNKASIDNPVEWGQDNTAMFLNLGRLPQPA